MTNINPIDDLNVVPWERGVRKSGPMNIQAMAENLWEFQKVMDAHGIKFVLTLGTLVGALREHTFIINDNDVDVMCLWPDYPKMASVIHDMQRRLFFVPEGCPIHDTNFIRNGEKIEVWWMGEVGGSLIYQPRFTLPKPEWFHDTIDYKFLGTTFQIPRDYDGFLQYVYKCDWRIPKEARWCGAEDKLIDNNR